MKIEKTVNSILFEFTNGTMIELWSCLLEIIFWKDYNWNTFEFINVTFENDTMMGGYELILVLLCCGLRIRIPHETPKSKKNWEEINKERDDINSGKVKLEDMKSVFGDKNGQ